MPLPLTPLPHPSSHMLFFKAFESRHIILELVLSLRANPVTSGHRFSPEYNQNATKPAKSSYFILPHGIICDDPS